MISPILNGYRYIITYESKQTGKQKSALIPFNVIGRHIDAQISPLLKGKAGLKEPWFSLSPETNPVEGKPLAEIFPEMASNSPEKHYARPEMLKKCVLQHPESNYAWLRLEIHNLNELLYTFQISMDDLFLPFIDHLAKVLFEQEMNEGNIIYYKIALVRQDSLVALGREDEGLLVPADQSQVMEDVFEIPKLKRDRTRIAFNKIREESLPAYLPGSFIDIQVKGRGKPPDNRIVMNRRIYDQLNFTLKLSQTEENGGYLIGNVYRNPDSPEDEDHPDFKWLVDITTIVPAEGTFGNSLLLLFTSETWSRLNQRIDQEFPNQKLIGWYHTHLFPASDSFGLSELDQVLHRQFFTKPWQVALLLNIETNDQRELRSFQRNVSKQKLEETRYEICSGHNNTTQSTV